MKYAIIAVLAATSFGVATAQGVTIGDKQLGSRAESATVWDNNVYHAPQYMPGHPTAATLYPRVVDVECTKVGTGLSCKGYNWAPEMGRGEYLMFRPVITEQQKPMVITNTIIKEVLVEVPPKKIGE